MEIEDTDSQLVEAKTVFQEGEEWNKPLQEEHAEKKSMQKEVPKMAFGNQGLTRAKRPNRFQTKLQLDFEDNDNNIILATTAHKNQRG